MSTKTEQSTIKYNFEDSFEMIYINNSLPLKTHRHSHDYYELFFFISGKARYYVNEQVYDFKKGDFILIPPNVVHYPVMHSSSTPITGYVLFVTQEFLADLCKKEDKIDYPFRFVSKEHQYIFHIPISTWHGILGGFQAIYNEITSNKFGHEFAAYIAVINFLIHLSRTIYYLTNDTEAINHNDELIFTIKNYIDANYFNEITLADTAEKFFIGASTLSHLFKEKTGISFYQYVIQKRLVAAKNDILSGKKTSKVYQANGFKDYSNFYKAFKKEFGVSPTNFLKHRQSTNSKSWQNPQ